MLWLIGAVAVLIDTFYRLSVPIDIVLASSIKNESTTASPTGNHLPLDTLLINDKGLSALMKKLNVKTADEAKALFLSLQDTTHEHDANNNQDYDANHHYADHQQHRDEFLQVVHDPGSITAKKRPHPLFPVTPGLPHLKDISHPLRKALTYGKQRDPSQSAAEGMYHGKESEPRGAVDDDNY